jgi:hypothetical protein
MPNILNANKAINAIKGLLDNGFDYAKKESGMFGGVIGSARAIKNGGGATREMASIIEQGADGKFNHVASEFSRGSIWDEVKNAHRAVGDEMSIGGYSASKMAGSYMAASAAGRLATGGGLFKDNGGNTDVIGLPLI